MIVKHPAHHRGDAVRLFADADAGQCLVLVGGEGRIITSKQTVPPWVDCVVLRSGRAGDLVPVAQQYGATFEIPEYTLPRGGMLYLGKNGFMKGAPEGHYSMIVGRYVDAHKFIFNPKLTSANPIGESEPSGVVISIDTWGDIESINTGDIVNYHGVLYTNLTGELSSDPPDEDETNWMIFASNGEATPSFMVKSVEDWSQVGEVFPGDAVNYNGVLYISLTGASTPPPGEDWEVLSNTAVNSYTHIQQSLAIEWVIDHNLEQQIVSVDVVNQAGEIMYVTPDFVSPYRLKLKFAKPVVGQALIRK